MNLNAAMESVIRYSIAESLPEAAVRKALTDLPREKGRLVVIAVGKAAWLPEVSQLYRLQLCGAAAL